MKKPLLILLSAFSISAFSQSGLANLDFENWVSSPMVCPAGFIGTAVTQQTSGAQHGANYARVSTTVSSGSGATGIMVLGSFTGSQFINGVPYASQPVSISGYYRSNVVGVGDTVGFKFALRNSTGTIATNSYIITSTQSSWTPVTITLNYSVMMNSDTVEFWAVGNPGAVGAHPNAVGSYLDADNFTINATTGIDPFAEGQTVFSFPNPATEEVIITASGEAARVSVYDMSGALLGVYKITNGKALIDTHSYSNGVYLYTVSDAQSTIVKTSKFVVAK